MLATRVPGNLGQIAKAILFGLREALRLRQILECLGPFVFHGAHQQMRHDLRSGGRGKNAAWASDRVLCREVVAHHRKRGGKVCRGAYGLWMADNRPMLTELVMKKRCVDKGKAFFMLYQEGKPLYNALSAAEKKNFEENAEAAKVKFQAESKEWNANHKENSKGGNSNGPKRRLGAYPQWIADNRPMLTEKKSKHCIG